MSKITKTDEEWKSLLTDDEYYVTRQKGTEPPFSGKNFEIVKGKISYNQYLSITKLGKIYVEVD